VQRKLTNISLVDTSSKYCRPGGKGLNKLMYFHDIEMCLITLTNDSSRDVVITIDSGREREQLLTTRLTANH